ncbi:TetR/AcrR family transcriptional regulator [Mycolicibacterium moriokaense]|nr:TetR/AcrR family transcriptional regulator [Mycolicibacterium moriokaense]
MKPDEYAARRREILDSALRLMHDKGYERMTIQDVLTDLRISKGALYHYFDSKQSLLEGIVEAMGESGSAALQDVVGAPDLDAVAKLHAYFATSTAWRAEHAAEVVTTMRLWRQENNALLRHKMSQETMRTNTPALEAIITQGCREGVFDTAYPHEAAIIIAGMGLHLADAIIDAIAADGTDLLDTSGSRAASVVAAYTDAFERILGALPGSLAAHA